MRTALSRCPAVAAAFLALSPLAAPADERPPEICPAIDNPAPAPAGPRVRAFVDPATGKLREPTSDELRRIAEERLRSRTATPRVFEIVTHADGMLSVDLGDAFLFDVRMEKRPDGSTTIECVPHAVRPGAAAER